MTPLQTAIRLTLAARNGDPLWVVLNDLKQDDLTQYLKMAFAEMNITGIDLASKWQRIVDDIKTSTIFKMDNLKVLGNTFYIALCNNQPDTNWIGDEIEVALREPVVNVPNPEFNGNIFVQ